MRVGYRSQNSAVRIGSRVYRHLQSYDILLGFAMSVDCLGKLSYCNSFDIIRRNRFIYLIPYYLKYRVKVLLLLATLF